MSYDKVSKRLKRHQDAVAVNQQLAICKFHEAVVTEPSGVFRKRHALNCGRSKCFLCSNPRRRFKAITLPERRVNEAMKYELLFI
ncbi:hypothetical protein PA10_00231 [Pseudomonas phage pPa_SNUABM_DT01]|nr:hypothetical protein PA10_00231 [Pseudomonas phage pPa_SNUABM_DT01]